MVSFTNRLYMIAGIIIPPKAAITGNIAFFKDDNSPQTNSLFISIPAMKKKKAIKKSLIQMSKLFGIDKNPI